jgi:D-alanyl-D-alanine carboxypeptidase
MALNGRLPSSQLSAIPGGRLRTDAAASWNRMRQEIGKRTGIWIAPTSPRVAYRTYAEQQYFWNLYRSGRGNLAAYPGTSNHGWGTAVDVATPAMRRAIDNYGSQFGWSKRWSDAPSEWWHIRYDPSHDQHKGERPKPRGIDSLTGKERHARDSLVKERRVAHKRGGWDSIPKHKARADKAKRILVRHLHQIERAAQKDGWNKANRRARHDYIKQVIG